MTTRMIEAAEEALRLQESAAEARARDERKPGNASMRQLREHRALVVEVGTFLETVARLDDPSDADAYDAAGARLVEAVERSVAALNEVSRLNDVVDGSASS